jgi:hypothetical protein
MWLLYFVVDMGCLQESVCRLVAWLSGPMHAMPEAMHTAALLLTCACPPPHALLLLQCDIAMLTVDDDEFWADMVPLEINGLPAMQESVMVVGFPTGGDNVCVTKGVVSRIDRCEALLCNMV